MDEESPLELRELEPSPVEDTPQEASSDSYFPSSTQATYRTSQAPGLGGHGLTWWLTRIQRVTTYPLAAFAILHISNTSIIPLATQSVTAADTYLLLTRPYYQSYPLEGILLGLPAALHVASGVALRWTRRQRNLKHAGVESDTKGLFPSIAALRRSAWPRLSATSALGYALPPLLAAHLALTRIAPTKVGVPNIDLSYVAHAVARSPWVGTASLAALIAVGASHVLLGSTKWLGLTPTEAALHTGGSQEDKRRARRRRWWEIAGLVVATVSLWMAGGLGVVARGGKAIGWEGRNYDKILNQLPGYR